MSSLKAVILAGGSGERFWPLSTTAKPKQFLRIFGGESLIRQCVTRLKGLVDACDVRVVTAARLVRMTRRELPELPRENVVGEPMRRDTGAAVALGTALGGLSDDDVLMFFPADQLIGAPARFRAAVRQAAALARRRETIVTLGIQPTYPATGFGYVDPKKGRFVEKPDVAKARGYLKRGYLWNAGMFIGRVGTFRRAIETFAPELKPLLALSAKAVARGLARIYEPLPRLSFDFAVMEKLSRAGKVSVVPCDCGWDDVGSFSAFGNHFKGTAAGNVELGGVRSVESRGCTAIAKGASITLLGVENLVVVTTKDHVLVVSKDRLSDMKKLFA